LRQIAEYGASEFYCGELAKRMVVGLKKLNCDLSEDDFAQHKTEVNTSLTMAFAGHELATSPPNSQGFVLLETLAALESLKIPLDPLGEKSRALLHASLMAAEDRDQYLGDPKTAHIPLSQLLDQTDLAVRLQKRLNKDARQTSFEGEHARGDTVAVCSIDTEGNSISLIQSVYQTFGSVVMEPETGVIFHNRARGFSFNPNASNKYIPNTRPAHTLMPLLIRKNGRTIMSIGTMGGRAQPQILAQVLAGALDEDMKPEDVLRQPRWIVGARDIDFVNLTVAIEADAPSALDNYLAIPGIDLVRIDSCTESVGHTQLVRLSPTNQLEAASDPRADGSASIV
jgi:gamma-glutamyltranspeptidase/glutathione hydrolase